MRIMGLDVGDKTIGVALSDELEIVATPVTVIRRTESVRKDIGQLRQIIEENGVQLIVVGMPFMLAGTIGIQAQKVESFIEALKPRVNIPVVTWDERLTTAEVERTLIQADQSRARRKEVIDKLAAAVMLQAYLDRHRGQEAHERAYEENSD